MDLGVSNPLSSASREAFREQLHRLCADVLYDEDEGPEEDIGFNFSFGATGPEVPHDAAVIESHPTYDAFDPISNESMLIDDRYGGPFSSFLRRAWNLLGWERPL